MTETRETRLRRLKMRSWRRGMKEMDLILGGYADTEMPKLDDAALDAHETLMEENDQDLYLWVCGVGEAPEPLKPALERVSAYLQQKQF
ncbi:MAG: succinate dehydrogenase assembly factor 2 [Rhodobacteraceae bacterium]|nr:succinate dehydrogenase assembly factor 2 [Paracoccaceae bacterium]